MSRTYRKRNGTVIVKDSNGKIARNLPADGSAPQATPKLPTPAQSSSQDVQGSAFEERARKQAEISQHKAKVRAAIAELTDAVEKDHPKALILGVDDDYQPVSIEDFEGNVLVDLENSQDYQEHVDSLTDLRESTAVAAENGLLFRDKSPQSSRASKGLFLSFKCHEDPECQYRTSHYGISPRHTAGTYCRSGRRPHCTCDSCF